MAFVVPVAEATAGRVAASRAAGGAAAKKAAAKKAATRRASVAKASSPITSAMSAEQVEEELQHRRKVAAVASRDSRDDDRDEEREELEQEKEAASDPVTKPDTGRRFDRIEPASSGAGFVLGVMAWTVAVNFLHGGMPQVRQLLRAKFLNKTDAGSASSGPAFPMQPSTTGSGRRNGGGTF